LILVIIIINLLESKYLITTPVFLNTAISGIEDTSVKTIFVLSQEKVEEKEENGFKILDFNRLIEQVKEEVDFKLSFKPKEDICILPYSSGITFIF
jgi:N-acetylglutamate synthase-like GNAT family acetyltransferase